jgi:HrpA-like RNA helicase
MSLMRVGRNKMFLILSLGLKHLEFTKISQATAAQRAGRTGRCSSGECHRLYTEDDFKTFDEFTAPALLTQDIKSHLLMVLCFNNNNLKNFKWIDAPSDVQVISALKELHEL